MKSKAMILTSLLSTMVGLFLIIVIPSALAYNNYISDKTLSPITEVDTREFFSAPWAVNFTLTKFGSDCPPEIAIYVHGFKRDNIEAKEEFNRIQLSLLHNNYRIQLVGWSWDSKTDWLTAKTNAIKNGPSLADFITNFTDICSNTDIRILAHSLGAAVVNNTLINLNQNVNWTDKIASVHLLGAAINNSLLVKDISGNAIKDEVDKFYNLYDPEDDGLTANQLIEKHQPLGLVGTLKMKALSNYNETNVAYEIPPLSDADGDGNVEECFEETNPAKVWGDNHCGYIGFRNSTTGSFLDDGVMNIAVEDWRNP
ncbi:MAG: hypothetical protein K0S93_784 [Nitrososphaeraceae archaeon]|jgi:hypothetical protein|nr:hypothetical protein [Nitrososphaeraceae archaeon]